MKRRVCSIVVETSSWQCAAEVASKYDGRETGGILLGWRHSAGVFVSDFIEVPDQQSTRHTYMRKHTLATERLETATRDLPKGSPVGYVGEWHTHSRLQGPSRTDRRELRRISRDRPASVALLIVCYDSRTGQWTPVGLCARAGRVRPAVIELRPPKNCTPQKRHFTKKL